MQTTLDLQIQQVDLKIQKLQAHKEYLLKIAEIQETESKVSNHEKKEI